MPPAITHRTEGSTDEVHDAPRTVMAGPNCGCGEMPAFYWVLPVIFVEFFTITLVTAFVPELESQQLAGNEYLIVGIASGINGILSLIGTPIIGRLSDAVGRKWVMFVTVGATALPACSLVILVPALGDHSMIVYEGLRAVSGILAATFSIAFAVVADVTTESERSQAVGAVVASFGLALSVSPITGALLARAFGTTGPQVLICLLFLVNAAYIAFVFPETLPPRPTTPRFCDHVRSPMETIVPLLSHPTLRLVAGIVFFVNVTEQGLVALLISYLQRHLGFTPLDLGLFALGLGLLMAASQACLLPRLLQRFEARTVILVATVTNAVQTALFGLVREKWQVFCVLVLAVVAFLGFAAASDFVSKLVPRTRQGQFQGAVTGIRALTNGIGPTLLGPLLTATCSSAAGGPPSSSSSSSSDSGGGGTAAPFNIECGTTFFVGSAIVLVAAFFAFYLPPSSESARIREEVRAAAREAEAGRTARRGWGGRGGATGDDVVETRTDEDEDVWRRPSRLSIDDRASVNTPPRAPAPASSSGDSGAVRATRISLAAWPRRPSADSSLSGSTAPLLANGDDLLVAHDEPTMAQAGVEDDDDDDDEAARVTPRAVAASLRAAANSDQPPASSAEAQHGGIASNNKRRQQ